MATQKKFVVKNGLIASDLSYPTADGTANQTIVTDGAGNLSFGTLNTSIVPESGNLYYTDARSRAAISENSTQLSYNNTSGVLTFTQGNTDTVTEGSNLYYTDARFDSRLTAKSTTDLSEGSNLYHTSTRVNSLVDTGYLNLLLTL